MADTGLLLDVLGQTLGPRVDVVAGTVGGGQQLGLACCGPSTEALELAQHLVALLAGELGRVSGQSICEVGDGWARQGRWVLSSDVNEL